jgi:hypothetical protein
MHSLEVLFTERHSIIVKMFGHYLMKLWILTPRKRVESLGRQILRIQEKGQRKGLRWSGEEGGRTDTRQAPRRRDPVNVENLLNVTKPGRDG